MLFTVIIHKDPDSDYGVTVPDLPGCFSAGDSLQDALANAREAIECHIEGLVIDEEKLSPAANLGKALKETEEPYRLTIIDIDLDKISTKKE